MLDKWHMYEILLKHNIEPRFREFHKNGVATAQDFVIAKLQGRNLNKSSMVCIAVEYDAIVNGTTNGRSRLAEATRAYHEAKKTGKKYVTPHQTRKEVAKIFNVSTVMLNYASVLFFENKELFEECKKGKSINSAYHLHIESRKIKEPSRGGRNRCLENVESTKESIEIPHLWDSIEKYDRFMDAMASMGWMFQLKMKNGLYNGNFYGNGFPEYTSSFKEVGAARSMKEAVTQAAFKRLGKK